MRQKRGFTLLEMMAVVVIMMISLGAIGLAFGNSRPSVKVKRDASQLVAFMRNMWDYSKSSGSALVLVPNFEAGTFQYTDPRTGLVKVSNFSKGVVLLALQVNDRIYSRYREPALPLDPEENADDGGNPKAKPRREQDEAPAAAREEPLFLSEGRGVSTLAVLIGRTDKDTPPDTYLNITLAKLNLITGKGEITLLEQADYDALMRVSEGQKFDAESAAANGDAVQTGD